MSTLCSSDYYRYNPSDGRCVSRQTNSVFYFVTSIVALLILTSVVMFCVCCVCLRRRRFLAANQMRTGPTLGLNSANVTFIGPISNYPRHMEEGRLSEIPASPPPKKNPGVAVIMPGEAEASFIAEPTTPVETAPNNSSHPDRSQEESSGTILIAHTKT
ncbi:hypothetical protein MPTK1_4g18900 [Marchantia polymorpha subsp. ruderalis]|uniref:Uncharacterized protein n=2 Tax=Marchantia polymorpha TaxID=3197 RepID=A0AAF6BBE4_MARPO|nr:hypothetical protein MARPO_0164s0020 [Marchantia polymorpha]BBN09328.1 hypothetical protein Mp_4g18900 [Marchantia polymorpha subsp. ruderalis]|eukprot:PTQ28427.1 hypothetical protein MARPO_0164s0020 [Marchantia polymorpha]